MPRVVGEYCWRRETPVCCSPESGSFVMTTGKVTVRPPSPGQHRRIGIRSRSTVASSTSWHGPERTRLGASERRVSRVSMVPPRSRIAPITPAGGRIRTRWVMRSATSSRASAPRANAMRRGEPRTFIATGQVLPVTFSNSRAGPSFRTDRWVISVISRSRLTGARTRRRSPRSSSAVRNSPRERNAILGLQPGPALNDRRRAGPAGKVHRRTPASAADAHGHPRAAHRGPRAPGGDPPEVLRPVRGGGAPRDAPPRARVAAPAPAGPPTRGPPGGRGAGAGVPPDPPAVRPPVVRARGAAAPDPGLHRPRPAAEPPRPPEAPGPRGRADHPHRPVPHGRGAGGGDVPWPRTGGPADPGPPAPGGDPPSRAPGRGPPDRGGSGGRVAHGQAADRPGPGVGPRVLRGSPADLVDPSRADDGDQPSGAREDAPTGRRAARRPVPRRGPREPSGTHRRRPPVGPPASYKPSGRSPRPCRPADGGSSSNGSRASPSSPSRRGRPRGRRASTSGPRRRPISAAGRSPWSAPAFG